MKLLLGIASLFGADYATKQYVEEHMEEKKEKKLFGGKLILRKYYNKGLAMNSFEENPKLAIGLSAAAFGFLFGKFSQLAKDKKNRLFRTGFVMVAAGALGNLYDHIFRGKVIDFISINVPNCKKIGKTVFNLADVFVAIGGFFMLIGILFGGKKKSCSCECDEKKLDNEE